MTLHDYFQMMGDALRSQGEVWRTRQATDGTWDLISGHEVRIGDKKVVLFEKNGRCEVDENPEFWHGTARHAIDAHFVWLRNELQSKHAEATRYDRPETPLRLPSFR